MLKNLTGPESQYDLLTIDVDENPDVASEYNVRPLFGIHDTLLGFAALHICASSPGSVYGAR